MTVNRTQVRVKAFCVGQAKSGTASLVGLLSANCRAAHEPEREGLLSMILGESRGELSAEAFRKFLLERDARLNLEYDVSWTNQFVIDHLMDVFPASKFIVLIRDSYSWLQSAIGHIISREMPPEILNFLPWWIKPERYPHSRHDRALAERGLYSIAAYLHAWNDHVDRCTGSIPEDRRLVIRTHELARSHGQLADFLQIPADTLDAALLLGPLYHLIERNDRSQALSEMIRILKPGGRAIVAFLNSWGLLRSGIVGFPQRFRNPDFLRSMLGEKTFEDHERSGFTESHWSNPEIAGTEIQDAGLRIVSYAGVEGFVGGMAPLLESLRKDEPEAYENVLEFAAETSELPQFRDATNHVHFVVEK